jgi:hypothetical protein
MSRNQGLVIAILGTAVVLVLGCLGYLLLGVSGGFPAQVSPPVLDSETPAYTYEAPSKRAALEEIDLARRHVTDIFVPGDEYATVAFRTLISVRLRQAREYVESGSYADALERLYLVEHDARDPTALGGDMIAEHSHEAIRLIQSLR